MGLQDDELGAWCAPGGAVPVQGETTWSFLHRVAVCYGLEVDELLAWGWWQWVNPEARSRGRRPDGDVLLNVTAQAQVAAWAGVPVNVRVLAELDGWWNPPWPLNWQRYYWAARHHLHGLPEGVVWQPGRPDEDQTR